MLDLRPFEQFQKIHLKDSTHFPIRYLNTTMMSSLPPRLSGNQIYNELILVGNKCQIEEAEKHFKERDWKVKNSILVNDDKDLLDLEKNDYQLEKNTGNNYKGKRLWKANQVLEKKIEEIEDLLFQNTHKKTKIENLQDQISNKAEKQKFKAIDLGCGRGRDTIFLAARNWFVQAIDNQQAFINALNFWSAEENLQDKIKTIIQDFKKEISVDPNQDLYIFSRFMNNNLLDDIIKNCKKGAFILVNHFLEGQSQNRKGK
ncbi:hypothetical protein PPERSA_11260 [Pseudocohnilembus persalinus]|uniref:Tellurite resistance methyltransferase TehB-like domain-containing protein n=1 Tax=Pseudocohnilembus persalinus TaxID=266149 RepID=A0A0V0QZI4_PSEPJ|nr:hypothetical protein PPERSA_11260 [Pseudocohnilembus persalinus]|eukprot:KRX07711.1 hypothetical protein PPERSA_11260 [Pseudocohnilembus persalinus]